MYKIQNFNHNRHRINYIFFLNLYIIKKIMVNRDLLSNLTLILYNNRTNDFNVMFNNCLAISCKILSINLDFIMPTHIPLAISWAIPFDPTEPLVNTTQTILNIQAILSNRQQRRMNRQENVIQNAINEIRNIERYFEQNCLINNAPVQNNISLCIKNLESKKIIIFFKKRFMHGTIHRIRPRKSFYNFIDIIFWDLNNTANISLNSLIVFIRSIFSRIYNQEPINPIFILFLPFILTEIILISLKKTTVKYHP